MPIITDGPKAGRIGCCVVGCGRTYKPDGANDVMCGKHYRLVDKRLRAFRRALLKRGNRLGWSTRMEAMELRAWAKAVRQANERSMGL